LAAGFKIKESYLMTTLNQFKVIDSHFHIIDKRFPLVPSQGYLPENFSSQDGLDQTCHYNLADGAIVSGSFQAFDQDYLLTALDELGPRFVGVTQIPSTATNEEIINLDTSGVRAVLFNLRRGGSKGAENLEKLAKRVHEIVGWHVELYVNSNDLPLLHKTLMTLPSVCIDHLGLFKEGFSNLLISCRKRCSCQSNWIWASRC
jgi:predicted TIM-barrel fold metal-dependent hydrolase